MIGQDHGEGGPGRPDKRGRVDTAPAVAELKGQAELVAAAARQDACGQALVAAGALQRLVVLSILTSTAYTAAAAWLGG
jgi:hypothetical protein